MLRFVLTFVVPMIVGGALLGAVGGYLGYYLLVFLGIHETKNQYDMIVPIFVVAGVSISTIACIKSFYIFYKNRKKPGSESN